LPLREERLRQKNTPLRAAKGLALWPSKFVDELERDGELKRIARAVDPRLATIHNLRFYTRLMARQEAGCAARLLRSLNARRLVVSFPARSLCGRAKGMGRHYVAQMQTLLETLPHRAVRLEFGEETFFVLRRDETSSPSAEIA